MFKPAALSPLEQHKADLEMVVSVCRSRRLPHTLDQVANLAEALLARLPEESHCINHPADQLCPECTS